MIKALEKSWSFISILLLFVLLGSLFFMPSMSGAFSIAALLVSLGIAILYLFSVQKRHFVKCQRFVKKQAEKLLRK